MNKFRGQLSGRTFSESRSTSFSDPIFWTYGQAMVPGSQTFYIDSVCTGESGKDCWASSRCVILQGIWE